MSSIQGMIDKVSPNKSVSNLKAESHFPICANNNDLVQPIERRVQVLALRDAETG